MREVDRIAERDFGLGVLPMMENAGRNLALHVMQMLGDEGGTVTVLAGPGGNGGGGLCCARHLLNRGYEVHLVLDREPGALQGDARKQFNILRASGLTPTAPEAARAAIEDATVVVDALIGYSLKGAPAGRIADLICMCNEHAQRVVALDVPSGMDATTGETPGVAVHPVRTLTLALPKTGLLASSGELFLADIGIPPAVFGSIGIVFTPFFKRAFWVQLSVSDQ